MKPKIINTRCSLPELFILITIFIINEFNPMHRIQPKEFRACPHCGFDDVEVLTRLSYALFDDSQLSNSYNLVSCARCGFVFCDTRSTASEFIDHYTKNQYYLVDSRGTGALDEKEKERYKSVLFSIQKFQPDNKVRIADIGSAKGGFLSYLKTQGYDNLLAIDLLPECIDFINTNNINGQIGSVEKIPLEANSVNIAILSHVLEHVLDLKTSLLEIFRVVADEGLVYVEVPSIEYGSTYPNAPLWDYLYEHINYFSKPHLISLFENNHFSCLEAGSKEILLDNGLYKCVYAVFQKNINHCLQDFEYHHIEINISGILESLDILELTQLTEIIQDRTPCYVWGLSAYMQQLIARTPVGKCNIIAFLDQSKYKQTKTINHIQVKSPELIKSISNNAVVILPYGPYINEMIQYLDDIKFSGKRIIL